VRQILQTTLLLLSLLPGQLPAAGVERPLGIGLGYGTARLSHLADYSGSHFSRLLLEYRLTQRLAFSLSSQPYGPFRAGEYPRPDIELSTLSLGSSFRLARDGRVIPYLGAEINWWDIKEISPEREALHRTGEALGFKAGLCITLGRRSCLRLEGARQIGIGDTDVDQINFGVIRYF
jgi:hypothetical protein